MAGVIQVMFINAKSSNYSFRIFQWIKVMIQFAAAHSNTHLKNMKIIRMNETHLF